MLGYQTATAKNRAGGEGKKAPGITSTREEIAAAADLLRRQTSRFPYAEVVAPAFESVLEMLPLDLDVPQDNIKAIKVDHTLAWESQDPAYYDRSFMTFMTDTVQAHPDTLFVTEKVMKPIMNASPFIYIGNAGALGFLRELGFVSFDPVIDETYDTVSDDMIRLKLCLDEMSRFAAADGDLLRQQFGRMWPAIEHNFLHFWGDAHSVLRHRFLADVLRLDDAS
jgi:hypothetical protein